MAAKAKALKPHELDENTFFIIAYIVPLASGIAMLLFKGKDDRRLRLHSIQAILLGILFIIVWLAFGFVFFRAIAYILDPLIWLYGVYVGLKAYAGIDIKIPAITDYAKKYSSYAQKRK